LRKILAFLCLYVYSSVVHFSWCFLFINLCINFCILLCINLLIDFLFTDILIIDICVDISIWLSIHLFIYSSMCLFIHSFMFLSFINASIQPFSLSFILSFILPYHSSHTPLFDYTDVLKKLPDLQFPLYVSDSLTYIDEMKSPRFIKTHLPWELLPKQIQDGTKQPKVCWDA
jgi:hypothetical protein